MSQKAISDRIHRALSMKIATKPAEVYRMLIIPELDSATLETDVGRAAESLVAVIRAGDVAIASGQRAINVRWQEIVLGDVLNENFTTKDRKAGGPRRHACDRGADGGRAGPFDRHRPVGHGLDPPESHLGRVPGPGTAR